jgi:hypothetical protein
MAIDRIPGVGPANSDIANATAAVVPNTAQITAAVPTAAQIATAVAAPSAATIAAAVAAPSSATIASAVAAAVPTIGAINTSVANNAPSPNAWTYITSLAGTGTGGVNFTGLSGYKAFKVFGSFNTGTTGWPMVIEVNGVTSPGFNGYGTSVNTNAAISPVTIDNVGRISPWGNLNGSGPHNFEFTITNANLSAPAFFNTKAYMRGPGNASQYDVDGYRAGNGPITSIRIYDPNNVQVIVGTFYLFGGN